MTSAGERGSLTFLIEAVETGQKTAGGVRQTFVDDKSDMIVRVVQDGARGQRSVKARIFWVDRLKATHENAPMTGQSDS